MKMMEALQKTDKPGAKVEKYLEVWSHEKAFDEAEQLKFLEELWKTKDEFERELLRDAGDRAVQVRKLKQSHKKKIGVFREQAAFKINALE